MNEQQEKVDAGLDSVKQAVSEMRLADQERSETIKTCKEEIDAIKEMLPKVCPLPLVWDSPLTDCSDDGEEQRSAVNLTRRIATRTQVA